MRQEVIAIAAECVNIPVGATALREENKRFFHGTICGILRVEELRIVDVAVGITFHVLAVIAIAVDKENGMSNRPVKLAHPHVGYRDLSTDDVGQGVVPVLEHILNGLGYTLRLNRLIIGGIL